jgi:hypothetical protein
VRVREAYRIEASRRIAGQNAKWGEMTASGATPPPPAEPGNLLALKHGARSRSDRLVIAEAEQLEAFLYEQYSHLVEADQLAVHDYCIARVRAWKLAAWIEANGGIRARSVEARSG